MKKKPAEKRVVKPSKKVNKPKSLSMKRKGGAIAAAC